MTFLIAAAGTGGHVFPGLAVGEALIELGVSRDQILYAGGSRMEAAVYPEAGFPFLGLELRGLQRSLTTKNLGLPRLVWSARNRLVDEIRRREVKVALGLGGYVTVPTAMAARRADIPLLLAEQNAGAGLANRLASRWAFRTFVSFPETHGIQDGEWVGNPVRRSLVDFDRSQLRAKGLARHGLDPNLPILGVFGGSLGAGALNSAARRLAASWTGPTIQMLHLTGLGNLGPEQGLSTNVKWHQVAFEERMELFYAACDLVVARAGGGVAELTVTGTPAILIPGEFGSAGHQGANAEFLRSAGAALVLPQDRIGELTELVAQTLLDAERLQTMSDAARSIAKPHAAMTIARAMLELAE
jgi:UDP-N-acetylglucosamine--N-acetylmuramyl-(pentapeptide) pyrophosphoryl-undecaprenol N-acetylglucosamine transferase